MVEIHFSGLHFNFNAQYIINPHIKEVLTHLQTSTNSWPKFLWVHPLTPGLMKPTKYTTSQGHDAVERFASAMEEYLKNADVQILDFRKLTTFVDSYDGTHFGTGVNMMKSQIILNYLADDACNRTE